MNVDVLTQWTVFEGCSHFVKHMISLTLRIVQCELAAKTPLAPCRRTSVCCCNCEIYPMVATADKPDRLQFERIS